MSLAWSMDKIGPIARSVEDCAIICFAPQREAWLARAEGRDGPVTVNLEGESFSGRFVDIDETGALIVETLDAGRRVVTAGEVFMS